MYEYLQGKIEEITPAYVVVDVGGTGYFLNISLNTYSELREESEFRVFVHQIVRDDALQLFGFSTKAEREIFRLLIQVNKVGANTARMILSTLTPDEVENAILSNNIAQLKKVKGIGAKTAQRVILDLKDKIGKSTDESQQFLTTPNNTIREEALSALVMLGFSKNVVEKTLDTILVNEKKLSVEELVKSALKHL